MMSWFRRRGFLRLLREKRTNRDKLQAELEAKSRKIGDWAVCRVGFNWFVLDCRKRYWKPCSQHPTSYSAAKAMMEAIGK